MQITFRPFDLRLSNTKDFVYERLGVKYGYSDWRYCKVKKAASLWEF